MTDFPAECKVFNCFIVKGESLFNLSFDDVKELEKTCLYARNCSFLDTTREFFENFFN